MYEIEAVITQLELIRLLNTDRLTTETLKERILELVDEVTVRDEDEDYDSILGTLLERLRSMVPISDYEDFYEDL